MNDLQTNILDVSNNYYNYLMNLENVVGVGLGYKIINSVNTFEPCLHVLVKKKISEKYLSLNNIIPKNYMGIKTDVVKTGKFKALQGRPSIPQKFRPLEGGCGISCYGSETEGTLGCIVSRTGKYNIQYFLLSNCHVIAKNNKVPLGTPIVQPPPKGILKANSDVIAYLDDYVPIKFMNGNVRPINYVDCAIAKITRRNLVSDKIFSVGKIEGAFKPILDENIKKVGFVTGLTTGKITTIGGVNEVEFDLNKKGLFKNQIIAKIPSDYGDSGSAILNEYNEVIGLLMSGSDEDGTITFNDINIVLRILNVEIYTQ